jgi:hypothetical protein
LSVSGSAMSSSPDNLYDDDLGQKIISPASI